MLPLRILFQISLSLTLIGAIPAEQRVLTISQHQNQNDYSHQSSFIDSLYGEITGPTIKTFEEVISVENDNEWDKQFHAQHTSYLQLQSSLNLPSNDFVDDILMDQNIFGGILTFGHLEHFNCFNQENIDKTIDIAIVGAPFDTGVSYRPGARFGPEAIRSNARRLMPGIQTKRNKNKRYPIDPYNPSTHNYSIVDCGDVSLTPFDNRLALNQLYRGQRAIHKHSGKQNKIPKIITLGGDHTITLMPLKSISEQYGKPIQVFHFDSHIDTWDPKILGGGITNYMSLNHGTFLHYAHEKGYILESGNYHVGLRSPLIDAVYDEDHDSECGFNAISADDIDKIGVHGIISKLKSAIKHKDDPVYISVDIDVLDPAYAPATGTMEVGGFTTRELLAILNGLKGINLVGADIVEVSPPYDTNSEITSLAATAVVDTFLKLMT
ncbi:arginase family-domain-containing protein [Scheffersomyces amazonensis]|uniref:arginase family-domain-containing protein n=1 Tax=Scheffersomyces amazonensis TaxID=1078765 RepID=UPI00315DF785